MHLLITGATGQVGSRFVPRLLQRGDEVRVLVRQAERAEFPGEIIKKAMA